MIGHPPRDWFDRDAAMQALVREFHCWRTGDWNAHSHAAASFLDEIAKQHVAKHGITGEGALLQQLADALRAP